MSVTYLYYDLETTGFSPVHHRICQIAVALSSSSPKLANDTNNKEEEATECSLEHFSSLVNPGCPIPPQAQKVHGIGTSMVMEAPCFAEVWEALCRWVQRRVPSTNILCLVGHNSWRFDDRFLCVETARHKKSVLGLVAPTSTIKELWSMDTLVLYQKRPLCRTSLRPKVRECLRLGDIYQTLVGKTLVGAHDALVDCLAVAAIHKILVEQRTPPARQCPAWASQIRVLEDEVMETMSKQRGEPERSFERALDDLDNLRCTKRRLTMDSPIVLTENDTGGKDIKPALPMAKLEALDHTIPGTESNSPQTLQVAFETARPLDNSLDGGDGNNDQSASLPRLLSVLDTFVFLG